MGNTSGFVNAAHGPDAPTAAKDNFAAMQYTWAGGRLAGGRAGQKYDSSPPRRRMSSVAQWKAPPSTT